MRTTRKRHTLSSQAGLFSHLPKHRKHNWFTNFVGKSAETHQNTQEKKHTPYRWFANWKNEKTEETTTSNKEREPWKSGVRNRPTPRHFCQQIKSFLFKKPREPIKLRVGLNEMMWLVVRLCRHIWSVPSRKRIANGGTKSEHENVYIFEIYRHWTFHFSPALSFFLNFKKNTDITRTPYDFDLPFNLHNLCAFCVLPWGVRLTP